MTGRLIYVIGPSGCGKDSLMQYARKHCPGSDAAFAHRYITRPADAGGENHVFLQSDEYQARLERGLFALHWDSHGFRYGVGREINDWMEAGLNVVVNGSRAYLSEADKLYSDLRPVLISVESGILRQRLILRGRESMDEIDRRLERAEGYAVSHPQLLCIDNSSGLSEAGRSLLDVIRTKPVKTRRVV